MGGLGDWLWPGVSFVLAVLWLGTLLRQRGRQPLRDAADRSPQRADVEDLLKATYVCQKKVPKEVGRKDTKGAVSVQALANGAGLSESQVKRGLEDLVASGWVEVDEQSAVRLTEKGEERAQELIRAHRLWERYLVDREGMAIEEIHGEAHRREHSMTADELEHLDAELGYPAWDPHGHAIPSPKCGVPDSPGRPVWELAEAGIRLRIVCLEDDSPPLLAQLVALGLRPGVEVEVVERDRDTLILQLDGALIPLAAAAADRVSVVRVPVLPLELGRLPVGATGRVVEIRGGGKQQRRMLDMGFVPGAEVTVMREAALGDPIQYRVKGTGVAMRRREANRVLVEEVDDG